MRLTKFNPETGQYEYIENAKTQAEFNAQRKAVIQRLGEYEDKASEVAEEIFAEIENLITNECLVLKDEQGIDGYVKASVHYAIAKLKKKHTESDG